MSIDYRASFNTELNRTGIYNRVSDLMPELQWRRAESETEGAHTVSGADALGFTVMFFLYDDEHGLARVLIWGPAEQQQLQSKLVDHVIPELQRAVPGPGEGPGREQIPSSVGPVRESQVGSRLSSGAEVVIDLFDWLPGWGEDSVEFASTNSGVALTVTYDRSKDPDDGTAEISVEFESVEHFYRYWLPSEKGLYDPGLLSGADVCTVYDVGDSSLRRRCLDDPNRSLGPKRELHHYVVFFLESGLAFEVIARSVSTRHESTQR